MVPGQVIVPIEVPPVKKVPVIVKSQHGSSNLVTEVIDVEEPVMKIAAMNWILCGHAKYPFSEFGNPSFITKINSIINLLRHELSQTVYVWQVELFTFGNYA
jgi:hypothetical protein